MVAEVDGAAGDEGPAAFLIEVARRILGQDPHDDGVHAELNHRPKRMAQQHRADAGALVLGVQIQLVHLTGERSKAAVFLRPAPRVADRSCAGTLRHEQSNPTTTGQQCGLESLLAAKTGHAGEFVFG